MDGGSSPLARGLRLRRRPRDDHRRIIPARAGFTRCYAHSHHEHWDHPRSRGVYANEKIIIPSLEGSSPLARGLPCAAPTPAPCASDHPRSRGVYREAPTIRQGHCGSSPLARGLPRIVGRPPRNLRIIPARAGFTYRWRSWSGLLSDHPRSRGVYGLDEDSGIVDFRIIPARAGFTAMCLECPATH